MPQHTEEILPKFLNTDASFENLKPDESPYLKGVQSGINGNPGLSIGTASPIGEGQNAETLTPTRSNAPVPDVMLPAGGNKNCGSYYSDTTKETYSFTFNYKGQHCIHVLNGDTGETYKVIQDPNLPFTDDQSNFIAPHRATLRFVKDKDGNIIEKFLMFTNAAGWQGFIAVNAAIATDGFDSSKYPYYVLSQPHYDRRELIEWPVRPPMQNPVAVPLPNTPADANTNNRMVDQAFQFAAAFNNTDGRPTTLSPYSLPLIIKSEDYLNNPDFLPKKALITFYAGSPLTESMDIYVRFTAKLTAGIPSTVTWGDWQKVERVYKFANQTGSPSDVLSTEYWLRDDPWANYSYDPIENTIEYVFDNSRLPDLVDQTDALRLQNDMPIKSVSLTDVSDAAALGDNLYGYSNLPISTLSQIETVVQEKANAGCTLETRKMRVYAYVGMCSDNFAYYSQVGYINGGDTTVRFGSLRYGGASTVATFDVNESKDFALDFADKKAFRCYLKGTPYFADGTWYQVNSDFSLVEIPNELDFSNTDTLTYIENIGNAQGFFVCVFDFEVPPGKYIACLGRHNVASTGDYRNTSTYVEGIANSRATTATGFITTLMPAVCLQNGYSKEMELDCTNGDVDVWGNGKDTFYVYCPYVTKQGNKRFRFIEGYLQESPNNPIGVELFPYQLTPIQANDDRGYFTDKNGFYFAYTKVQNANIEDIEFVCKLNCQYPIIFRVPTDLSGPGWRPNKPIYITDHNNGVVGDCNRVLVTGKITDLTGTIPYSNIAISIVDGGTAYTQADGTFTLVVHNGQDNLRVSNIYVSAAGNFIITIENCGALPTFIYNESLAPCFNCNARNYPVQINLKVQVQGGTQYSLKENATYPIGIALADLAGRLTYVNITQSVTVPSFIQRQDLLATYFQMLINGALNLDPDFAYIAPYVGKPVNLARYFQWVGDSISYIDNSGNVVSDPSTAVFISIAINSFYNYAVGKNFSILSSYQFTADDRLRILDDGNGNLLTAPIDVQVLGTNYNQASQTAGIVPSSSTVPIINNNTTVNNTVNTATNPATTTTATQQNNTNITLYIKYDTRFNSLVASTGFWIEIYTPAQQAQLVQYGELTWFPVINGEIAVFEGLSNGKPVFSYPTTINLPYWDTYLFYRNIAIPNVGDKYLNHPFESPNISDSFGANVTSAGRQWEKNDDAQQQWLEAHIIKSDAFVGNGIINGIGTFRSSNAKNFTQYPFGAIQAMVTQRSIIFILCENDWFTVSFDFHFAYPNAQGVMVVNLDQNISTPNQKIGSNYGLAPENTGTVIVYDKHIFWYDSSNEAWVISDYRSAEDISDIVDEKGNKYGVKSYFIKKTQFINDWNISHMNSQRFDTIAGIDMARGNIYVTFRPRRNSTNDLRSYINKRRNVDLSQQETIVYSISEKRWTRFEGFAPEGYAVAKGQSTGVEMVSYAAGFPYLHNNTGNQSFLQFYGIQTEPVISCLFNKANELVKILQSISLNNTDNDFYVDLCYDTETNSFTYIPQNQMIQKENMVYANFNRDMMSYPNPDPKSLYQSMLFDGKNLFGDYFFVRLVGNPQELNIYFQLTGIYYLFMTSSTNKK